MSPNTKKSIPYLIAFAVFSLLAVGLVGLGVHINSTEEARFMEATPGWAPEDFPLGVCAMDDRGSGGDRFARVAVAPVIARVSQRLGFHALTLDASVCQIIVALGVPAEPGWMDPGGAAEFQPGGRICSVSVSNVHGELEFLTIHHELGHCLGLAHDDFEQSIMFPTQRKTPPRTLPPWISDVDRDAIRERYLR